MSKTATFPGMERPKKSKARKPASKQRRDPGPCNLYQLSRAKALGCYRRRAPWPEPEGETIMGLYILCYVDAYGADPKDLYDRDEAELARAVLGRLGKREPALAARDRDDKPGYVRYLAWAFRHEKKMAAADQARGRLGYKALSSAKMLERWIASERED